MNNSKILNKIGDMLYESEYVEDWGPEQEHFCSLIDALRLNSKAQDEILVSVIGIVAFCQRHAFKSGFKLGVNFTAGALADVNINTAEESEV